MAFLCGVLSVLLAFLCAYFGPAFPILFGAFAATFGVFGVFHGRRTLSLASVAILLGTGSVIFRTLILGAASP